MPVYPVEVLNFGNVGDLITVRLQSGKTIKARAGNTVNKSTAVLMITEGGESFVISDAAPRVENSRTEEFLKTRPTPGEEVELTTVEDVQVLYSYKDGGNLYVKLGGHVATPVELDVFPDSYFAENGKVDNQGNGDYIYGIRIDHGGNDNYIYPSVISTSDWEMINEGYGVWFPEGTALIPNPPFLYSDDIETTSETGTPPPVGSDDPPDPSRTYSATGFYNVSSVDYDGGIEVLDPSGAWNRDTEWVNFPGACDTEDTTFIGSYSSSIHKKVYDQQTQTWIIPTFSGSDDYVFTQRPNCDTTAIFTQTFEIDWSFRGFDMGSIDNEFDDSLSEGATGDDYGTEWRDIQWKAPHVIGLGSTLIFELVYRDDETWVDPSGAAPRVSTGQEVLALKLLLVPDGGVPIELSRFDRTIDYATEITTESATVITGHPLDGVPFDKDDYIIDLTSVRWDSVPPVEWNPAWTHLIGTELFTIQEIQGTSAQLTDDPVSGGTFLADVQTQDSVAKVKRWSITQTEIQSEEFEIDVLSLQIPPSATDIKIHSLSYRKVEVEG